jgi:hypothetical protein
MQSGSCSAPTVIVPPCGTVPLKTVVELPEEFGLELEPHAASTNDSTINTARTPMGECANDSRDLPESADFKVPTAAAPKSPVEGRYVFIGARGRQSEAKRQQERREGEDQRRDDGQSVEVLFRPPWTPARAPPEAPPNMSESPPPRPECRR